MRSATSYFNGTLYRKTLARFWPLWVGYGVALRTSCENLAHNLQKRKSV